VEGVIGFDRANAAEEGDVITLSVSVEKIMLRG
jgi:hypothetical protein